MIDPRKSKFKKLTNSYNKDSLFDIIDIEEAIMKNKTIKKCIPEEFIYYHPDQTQSETINKKCNLPVNDYDFILDNDKIEKFSNLYEIIDVIGEGSFGIVISAKDILKGKELVAIKVRFFNILDNTEKYI